MREIAIMNGRHMLLLKFGAKRIRVRIILRLTQQISILRLVRIIVGIASPSVA